MIVIINWAFHNITLCTPDMVRRHLKALYFSKTVSDQAWKDKQKSNNSKTEGKRHDKAFIRPFQKQQSSWLNNKNKSKSIYENRNKYYQELTVHTRGFGGFSREDNSMKMWKQMTPPSKINTKLRNPWRVFILFYVLYALIWLNITRKISKDMTTPTRVSSSSVTHT